MLNRRYAVLGWTVWQVGKRMAKRRAKAMVPSTSSSNRGIGIAPVIPVAAALALAGAWFFFRRHGAGREAELVG